MTSEPSGPSASDGAGEPALLARLKRLSRWRTPSGPWRGVLLVVAAATFAGGVALSLRELELAWAEVRWWPLAVVALVGTPATIAVNAAELRAMATTLDRRHRLAWPDAVRTVLLATAANVLPLPGGALVRVHALTVVGVSLSRATAINLLAAVVWVAAAVLVAGVAGLAYAPVAAAVALVAGVGVLGVAGLGARAVATDWRPAAYLRLVAIEVATTLVHGARLWLVLVALDVEVALAQALVLGVAAPLAAAAGVFPSGLGLAELLTALLAPLVALPAAAGFAATAVARVVGLVASVPAALAVGVRDVRGAVTAGADPPDGDDRPDTPDAPGSRP